MPVDSRIFHVPLFVALEWNAGAVPGSQLSPSNGGSTPLFHLVTQECFLLTRSCDESMQIIGESGANDTKRIPRQTEHVRQSNL